MDQWNSCTGLELVATVSVTGVVTVVTAREMVSAVSSVSRVGWTSVSCTRGAGVEIGTRSVDALSAFSSASLDNLSSVAEAHAPFLWLRYVRSPCLRSELRGLKNMRDWHVLHQLPGKASTGFWW
jgi:hypothetical protein